MGSKVDVPDLSRSWRVKGDRCQGYLSRSLVTLISHLLAQVSWIKTENNRNSQVQFACCCSTGVGYTSIFTVTVHMELQEQRRSEVVWAEIFTGQMSNVNNTQITERLSILCTSLPSNTGTETEGQTNTQTCRELVFVGLCSLICPRVVFNCWFQSTLATCIMQHSVGLPKCPTGPASLLFVSTWVCTVAHSDLVEPGIAALWFCDDLGNRFAVNDTVLTL